MGKPAPRAGSHWASALPTREPAMICSRIILGQLVLQACAAGPHDVLDGTSHDVRVDAGPKSGAYAYVAKRSLVAVGLAASQGLTDEETHRLVDRLADEASACFKRSRELASGAGRITLPIDAGGGTGTPVAELTPPSAAALGMVCILAPMRLTTFAPAAESTARSITIEAAWGTDVAP